MAMAEQVLRDVMAGGAGAGSVDPATADPATADPATADPATAGPATAGMDRPLSLELRRRRLILRIAVALAAVGSAAGLFTLGSRWLTPSIDRDRLRTTRVERGPIEEVVGASGLAVPVAERAVTSPVDGRILAVLRAPGSALASGDAILQIDASTAAIELERLDERIAQSRLATDRARADLESARSDLAGRIEIKRLEQQTLQSALKGRGTLFAQGLVSSEDLHRAELDEKRAAVELEQLVRSAEEASRSAELQLRGLDLERGTLAREREKLARDLDAATARAERPGVLTWVFSEVGAAVRRGDVVARVADLSAYRIDGTVSDVHAARLKQGQRAIVSVVPAGGGEAARAEHLEGHVESVLPAVSNGQMTLRIALDRPDHPSLRPSLRVDVAIVTDSRPEALRVEKGPFLTGEKEQAVFVVRGDRLVRARAVWGLSGVDAIEVESGLAEGDEVVLSSLRDREHHETIRLR